MNLRLPLFCAATLCLVAPVSAQNVVSYLASTPPVMAASGPDLTTSLRVPAFDASLGTLTQVKITFASAATQSVRLENLGSAEGRFSYRMTTSLALDLGRRTVWTSSGSAAGGTVVLGAFDGVRDFAGRSGFAFDRTITAIETRLEADVLALASFTGPEGLEFLLTTAGQAMVEGPGNSLSLAGRGVVLTVELEYTYTPVPELKGSALFIGMLAFGLLLWSRHRDPVRIAGKEA